MKPYWCPFCRSSVSLIDSAKIFGQSYGFIYLCDAYPDCDARVGCHPRSIKPLGTLAD
ncbi:zinc-finger-containing protein, partial [Chlorogloea sp. CCALA 695]|uniref:zinc-finger-containing protein n=1 Tax=Chlorogloea sp. CCALA 695 TaxID=2107693 RepID=UPI000D447E35